MEGVTFSPLRLLFLPIELDVRMEPERREQGAGLTGQAWKALLVEETGPPHTRCLSG